MSFNRVNGFTYAPVTPVFWPTFAGSVRNTLRFAHSSKTVTEATVPDRVEPREEMAFSEMAFSEIPTEVQVWAQTPESGIANPATRLWRYSSPEDAGAPKSGKEFYVTISIPESVSVAEDTAGEPGENAVPSLVTQSRQRQFTLRRIGAPSSGTTSSTYYVGDDAKTGEIFWCAVRLRK